MIQTIKANKTKALIIAVLFLSLVFRLVNINTPLENDRHNFRGTQTAFTVKSLMNNGFSLTEFEIPTFGEPWDTVYFEYPVYQIIVYLFMKVFHGSDIDFWCRLVHILFFYLSAFVLYKFVRSEVNRKAATVVSLFYIILPYTIYWSRTALIEYTGVFFALLYCYFLLVWIRKPDWLFFLLTILAGCMAYISKSTTMFGYVYFLALYIPFVLFGIYNTEKEEVSFKGFISYYLAKWKYILLVGVLCIFPVVPGAAWIRYADMRKRQNPYTVYMTSAGIKAWNFGTLHQRIDWGVWKGLGEQYIGFLFGGGTVFLLLVILSFHFGERKYRWIVISALLASFGAMFTLINLYYEHDYYQAAITPLTCIAGGIMLYSIIFSQQFAKSDAAVCRVLAVSLCVVCISAIYGHNFCYIDDLISEGSSNADAGLLIAKITEPEERILIDGEDWSPRILYYADRKGFMIRDPFAGEFSEDYLDTIHLGTEYTTVITKYPSLLEDLSKYTNIGIQYLWDDTGWSATSGDPDASWAIARMMTDEEYDKLPDPANMSPVYQDDSIYRLDTSKPVTLLKHDKSSDMREVKVRVRCAEGTSFFHKVYLLPDTENTVLDSSLLEEKIEEIEVGSDDITGLFQ